MFSKQLDLLTIGDITTDAFIRLKDAHVHCSMKNDRCELCMQFGAKIPFEYVKIVKAVGNAANVATAVSKLGLNAAIVSNVGDDEAGRDCIKELAHDGVATTYIKKNTGKATNYHFVLWYGAERTILVNHIDYDYVFPKFAEPKWIYLTSTAPSKEENYLEDLSRYLKSHPKVKLAFQPGTYQLKAGLEKMKEFYSRSEVLMMNMEEAKDLIDTHETDVKVLLKRFSEIGAKISVITNNTDGSYMYDGEHYYHMPMYPDPRPALERTGCGDSFSATFISALIKGLTPLQALVWAPVNPMSVAQFVGSKEGLLTAKEINWWLERAGPSYRPREI